MNLYIKNGWDQLYLRHPEKHNPKTYSSELLSSHDDKVKRILNDKLPVPQKFTNSLSMLPCLEESDIFHYFLVKCDNTSSTARKHRDKGWNFYKSDKVKRTEIADVDDELLMVKGVVIASYDKGNITGKIKKKNMSL